jgi:hypothetical protein
METSRGVASKCEALNSNSTTKKENGEEMGLEKWLK